MYIKAGQPPSLAPSLDISASRGGASSTGKLGRGRASAIHACIRRRCARGSGWTIWRRWRAARGGRRSGTRRSSTAWSSPSCSRCSPAATCAGRPAGWAAARPTADRPRSRSTGPCPTAPSSPTDRGRRRRPGGARRTTTRAGPWILPQVFQEAPEQADQTPEQKSLSTNVRSTLLLYGGGLLCIIGL